MNSEELKNPPRIRRKLLVCAVGLGQLGRVRELALELEEKGYDWVREAASA